MAGIRRRRRAVAVLAAVAVAAVAAGCGGAQEDVSSQTGLPSTLRVGLIPNIAPDQQRAKYEPLQEYLQQKLGTQVELFVATDYAGVVTALTSKRIDVAYLGGLTYVQAERQSDVVPLVTEVDQETHTPRYLSAIVVRKDSPYQSVKDLLAAEGTFAFGDVSSTSGSLYPRIMLDEAGAECSARTIETCPPLKRTTFTGGHDATAKAVIAGSVDAGGLELRILHRLGRDGKVDAEALRVIATKEAMGYPWVARTALGQKALDAIRAAFLAINDPDLLGLMRAEKYVSVSAADYNEIRQGAGELGLLRQ